jgi:hypothetical protein
MAGMHAPGESIARALMVDLRVAVFHRTVFISLVVRAWPGERAGAHSDRLALSLDEVPSDAVAFI